jgi:hypothetical protein
MKILLIISVVLAILSCAFAHGDNNAEDHQALVNACRELNGGGTKVRLEFDLSGACRGNCGGKKKRKKNSPAPEVVPQEPPQRP